MFIIKKGVLNMSKELSYSSFSIGSSSSKSIEDEGKNIERDYGIVVEIIKSLEKRTLRGCLENYQGFIENNHQRKKYLDDYTLDMTCKSKDKPYFDNDNRPDLSADEVIKLVNMIKRFIAHINRERENI